MFRATTTARSTGWTPGLLATRLGSLAGRIVTGFEEGLERHQQRRRLEMLDDHALHDLGLTRGDVHREVSKLFWQP